MTRRYQNTELKRHTRDEIAPLRPRITTSDRTRDVVVQKSGAAILLSVSEEIAAADNERKRLFSLNGVREVQESARETFSAVRGQMEGVIQGDKEKLFRVKMGHNSSVIIEGPFRLFVISELKRMMQNSAREAEFSARIGQRPEEYTQEGISELQEIVFKPRMIGTDAVCWDESNGKAVKLTPEKVADYIIKVFGEHIKAAYPQNPHQHPRVR